MAGYPFDAAMQARMRAVFERAGREGYHADGGGNPDFRKFEERLSRLKTKMKDHLDRHAPVWVGREARKLLLKHKGQLKPVLTPKWILQTKTSPAAIARQAIQNVELRNTKRLTRVDEMAERIRLRLNAGLNDNLDRKMKINP